MKKYLFLVMSLMIISCKTIDVEQEQKKSLAQENEILRNELEQTKEMIRLQTVEDEYTYDIEPVIIPTTTYVVVDRNEKVNEPVRKEGKEAVKESMKKSIVNLTDYVGGTSIFDYNENNQFPVFTKKLSMTTIILNNDEQMVDTQPFLSDTTSWEITGDVWISDSGERQIIMVKPKESNLETNMLIVTNKRLYHFVLYSTLKEYQPIVKFRYPLEKKFITSQTKKQNILSVNKEYDQLNESLLSFNYKIEVPTLQKKIDWVPEIVYDDGSHTYIRLPEIVLQKEMPAVWEGNNEIVNYEIHANEHNLIIINKLIEKVTLKIGKEKVIIIKKKGNPEVLSVKR